MLTRPKSARSLVNLKSVSASVNQAYTRAEACRVARISERQLNHWEAERLIVPLKQYDFSELLALTTIAKLRKSHRPTAQIRRAIEALQEKVDHIADPLTQLRLYAVGKRIHVDLDGQHMEAESGQLLLNFDPVELKRLVELRKSSPAAAERNRKLEAERWFQRGLELEQTGAQVAEIVQAYQKAIELDPKSAGALVNLGTLHFNRRDWKKAEKFYLRALEIDPNYALAHFDLANLYDERGHRDKAADHYQSALRISPNYADAHYNLALLYQGANQSLKAVRHWKHYLKLDPNSKWASIARRELDKLRETTLVRGAKR